MTNSSPNKATSPSKATSAVVDPARSAQMALVRSRDTKPETRVRKALHAAGLRYRLHDRRLPGSPDLVFASRRLVVFVHGCFWHQHAGCAACRMPKTRQDFWRAKLEGNVTRDARQVTELEAQGWRVLVVWECETRDATALNALARLIAELPTRPALPRNVSADAGRRRGHVVSR